MNNKRRTKLNRNKKRNNTKSLEYGTLEERRLLIVGFAAPAAEVLPGGNFDGVVFTNGCTGALLTSGSHVITAAHCLPFEPGEPGEPDIPKDTSVRFDLARDSNLVPVKIPVSAENQIAHPDWDQDTRTGNDIAIYELEDQDGNRLVAPFGAQQYGIASADDVLGDYIMVGYGESGTGATGEQRSEVQRITALNSGSGNFTVSFNGITSSSIPFTASPAQVRAALNPFADNASTEKIERLQVSNEGLPAGTWDVRFRDAPGVDQPLMTGSQADGTPLLIVTQFDGGSPNVAAGVKRVGMNTYDLTSSTRLPGVTGLLFSDFDDGSNAANLFGGTGLGSQETFEARGDSGGAGFRVGDNGSLEIVSVVSATLFSSGSNPEVTTDVNNYQGRDNSFGEGRINTNVPFFKSSFIDPIVNATGYHAVLDMDFQVLGNDNITEDLQFIVQRQGGDLVVSVNNLTASGVYAGEYFRDSLANLTGFTINGAGDNETFVIQNDLGIDITIDGGGGLDTLEGTGTTDAFLLTGFNSGEHTTSGSTTVTTFTGIETVDGGAGIDFFSLTSGYSFTTIQGGADNDIIVGSNDAANWKITGDKSGELVERFSTFSGIEGIRSGTSDDIFTISSTGRNVIIEGNSGTDTITGDSTTWTLTDTSQGEITDRGIIFGEIERVTGGVGADTFEIQSAAADIEIDGNDGQDNIVGPDAATIWAITGTQAAAVAAIDIRIHNMETIQAGSADDSFVLAAGDISMSLLGGGGTNTVAGAAVNTNWDLSGVRSGAINAQNVTFAEVDNFIGDLANDEFVISPGFAATWIDGRGGDDQLSASDLANVYRVDRAKGGNSQIGGYTFRSIENITAGAGNDELRLATATAGGLHFEGGEGTDNVFGFSQTTNWRINSNKTGAIHATSTTFSNVEKAIGGSALDRFILSDGVTDYDIDGGAGRDVIRGANASRNYVIDGKNQGSILESNTGFENIETIVGGVQADRFSFVSTDSSIGLIDGRGGFDTADYSQRGRMDALVTGFGTSSFKEGFDGWATGLDRGYFNIDKIVGSSDANGDFLGGNQAGYWKVDSALSFFFSEDNSLVFENFEKLRGGDQQDYFFVVPGSQYPITVLGGAPTSAPGDRLKVDLNNADSTTWQYFASGAGRFSFNGAPSITYSQIETLDVFEYGDAAGDGTLSLDNGPRHRLGTPLRLGSQLDPEADGLPSALANGDDLSSQDDEDGVFLPANLISQFKATVFVYASQASKLDAWIDYNQDGTFSSDEQIATSRSMVAGVNQFEFRVPLDAVDGVTNSRFRLSTSGGLSPVGQAEDGEVEDHSILVRRVANGTAEVLPDPLWHSTEMLVMAGTSGNDNIVVNPVNSGNYQVKINGHQTGLYPQSVVRRIGAFGLEGVDTIVADSGIGVPVEFYGNEGKDSLFGGANADYIRGGQGDDKIYGHGGNDHLFGEQGDDQIYGGTGNDLLVGNDGNDRLWGGEGNDSLFSGRGADWLYGQRRDDLLVGNSYEFDENEYSLGRLRDYWADSSLTYAAKSTALRSSSIGLRIGDRIQDDNELDRFFGGTELDLFADLGAGDLLHDFDAGEFAFKS